MKQILNILIYILFITVSLSANLATAQVPIDLGSGEKNKVIDSTQIWLSRYDSLVNHMNTKYLKDNTNVNKPKPQVPQAAAVKPAENKPVTPPVKQEKTTAQENQPEVKSATTSQPSINTQPGNSVQQQVPLQQNPVPTKKPAPKPKPKPKPKATNGDGVEESGENEEYSTEELLVDTNEVELLEEEDSDVGDAEGEFDNLFTGYSDVSYWDLWRDPNFKFSPEIIPANHHYPFDWDTVTINPYKISLSNMNDTILLKLKDSMDCSFHPPAIGDITSGFGPRRWGRKAKFHYGVDVRMEVGDPVYAIFDGVVRIAKRSSDYGYVVLIRHYNGLETLYAHFDQLLAYAGKPVRSGEIIGLSGNTGRSTGPHLHFEVRFKGEKIDPNKIISFPTGSLLSDTLQIDRHCFTHVKLYKEQQEKLRSRYYVVKRGDTLGKIAYKTGVPAKRLAKLNRISTKTKLKAGRRIRLR